MLLVLLAQLLPSVMLNCLHTDHRQKIKHALKTESPERIFKKLQAASAKGKKFLGKASHNRFPLFFFCFFELNSYQKALTN
uniref:Secreted protein n=1 Tax=Rhizophora mucronata TaxID=61149 RepID=A0A2P2LAD8_RHIMU